MHELPHHSFAVEYSVGQVGYRDGTEKKDLAPVLPLTCKNSVRGSRVLEHHHPYLRMPYPSDHICISYKRNHFAHSQMIRPQQVYRYIYAIQMYVDRPGLVKSGVVGGTFFAICWLVAHLKVR